MFQSADLKVAFFEVIHVQEGSDTTRVCSLSKLTVDCPTGVGDERIKAKPVTCEVKGLITHSFRYSGMRTLAHVLHSGGAIWHKNQELYEWAQILYHPEIQGLGASLEAINNLAQKLNAPFKFKSTASIPHAN